MNKLNFTVFVYTLFTPSTKNQETQKKRDPKLNHRRITRARSKTTTINQYNSEDKKSNANETQIAKQRQLFQITVVIVYCRPLNLSVGRILR